MIGIIRKIFNGLGKVEEILLTALFALAFLIILAQAVSRYVFNDPIIWTDEVSVTLQMLIGFLGIGYGIRTKTHIKVDTIYQKFPRKLQLVISFLFSLMFIIAAVIMVKYGIKYAVTNWNINFGTFKFGKGKTFLALPIGYGLAIAYSILDMTDEVLEFIGRKPVFELGKEKV